MCNLFCACLDFEEDILNSNLISAGVNTGSNQENVERTLHEYTCLLSFLVNGSNISCCICDVYITCETDH